MRYYVVEDGKVVGSVCDYEEAVYMIERRKARQTHWLKSDYYIIKGEEIFPKSNDVRGCEH